MFCYLDQYENSEGVTGSKIITRTIAESEVLVDLKYSLSIFRNVYVQTYCSAKLFVKHLAVLNVKFFLNFN